MRQFVSKFWFAPLLLLFWNLGYAPFWNPDEGRYAAASLEMARPITANPPDWLVPHLNTAERLNKPPLVYWLAATSFTVLGPSEVSGRLPSALAAFFVALLLFYWGRRAFGVRAGQFSALCWGSMVFPFAMGRVLNTDMLLTFSMALASFGVWNALRDREEGVKGRQAYFAPLWAGLGMGLALLAKGPVGVAFPLLIGFVYLCLARSWGKAPWRPLFVALALACVVGVPWYLAVQARVPDFLHRFLLEENLGRFSGKEDFHDDTSAFFYVPVLLLGVMPWTGFVWAVFAKWTRSTEEGKARLYALVHAGLIVGIFSLSDTKLISYVLPAFPAIALLLGAAVSRWTSLNGGWRLASLITTAVLNLVVVVAATIFLTDDRTIPRGEAWAILVGVGTLLLLATIGLFVAARRRNDYAVGAAQVVTGGLLFMALCPVANHIAPYEDAPVFFRDLRTRLQPGDRVIGYNSFLPTAVFYCQRPIYFFGFKNTSGLRNSELKQSEFFPGFGTPTWDDPATQKKLLGQIMEGRRVWIWSKGPLPLDLEATLYKWGRNNDFFYYSNQPKPEGYVYDFVAPRKRDKEFENLPGRKPAAGGATEVPQTEPGSAAAQGETH